MTAPTAPAPPAAGAGPLVTFGLITYRQEAFVAEAVHAALAQDYHHLEIVICDDASPDRTWEIASEIGRSYSGPHTIRMHRNDRNLGIGNFNRLMGLSSGNLVVIAHGDDLSRPDRVRLITQAWMRTGASMVASNWVTIDSKGRQLGTGIGPGRPVSTRLKDLAEQGRLPCTLGAVLAWDRRVFEVFGPLRQERSAITSDYILPFRAALLNGIEYLDTPLVAVRMHQQQKFQRYIGNDPDPHSLLEGQRANQLIQGLYMLETLRTAELRQLKPAAVLQETYGQLLRFILATGMDWGQARNHLYASGLRPRWTTLDT